MNLADFDRTYRDCSPAQIHRLLEREVAAQFAAIVPPTNPCQRDAGAEIEEGA